MKFNLTVDDEANAPNVSITAPKERVSVQWSEDKAQLWVYVDGERVLGIYKIPQLNMSCVVGGGQRLEQQVITELVVKRLESGADVSALTKQPQAQELYDQAVERSSDVVREATEIGIQEMNAGSCMQNWTVKEPDGSEWKVQAVSKDSALHKVTRGLMEFRGIIGTPYIDGPYTQIRKTLTCE